MKPAENFLDINILFVIYNSCYAGWKENVGY